MVSLLTPNLSLNDYKMDRTLDHFGIKNERVLVKRALKFMKSNFNGNEIPQDKKMKRLLHMLKYYRSL